MIKPLVPLLIFVLLLPLLNEINNVIDAVEEINGAPIYLGPDEYVREGEFNAELWWADHPPKWAGPAYSPLRKALILLKAKKTQEAKVCLASAMTLMERDQNTYQEILMIGQAYKDIGMANEGTLWIEHVVRRFPERRTEGVENVLRTIKTPFGL